MLRAMFQILSIEAAAEAPVAGGELAARIAGLKRALRLLEPSGGGPSCDAALQETLKDSKFRPEPGSVTATSDYHQAAPIEETQVNQQYLEN